MKHIDGRWLRWATAIDTESFRSNRGPGGASHAVRGPGADTDAARAARKVSDAELRRRIGSTALAFRGYDATNLGRSAELLDHPLYGPVVRRVLGHVSEIASAALHAPIDLAAYIRGGEQESMATFPLDVATIVAMELAQIEVLEAFFGVPVHQARLSFGYSIGELSALIVGGNMSLEHLLPVPLQLAPDCAALAEDTTLGVLFTRGGNALGRDDVERLCRAISGEGHGLIGPSAYLSPNTALLLGQGKTLARVEALASEYIPGKALLKRNPNRWPPLHSPLVWERSIPNRAAMMLYHIEECAKAPTPRVVSCVTGESSYDGLNTRELLVRWTDHPQRLWDVIDETLTAGVEVIVHVGPAPSLIAATFARLENNVSRQLGDGRRYLNLLGRGLASGLNHHAWLARLLPSKAALLRLPYIAHVNLEDWLLEQEVPKPSAVAFPAPEDDGSHDVPATPLADEGA